jgi:SNF2 family DNA or RNA helicase
MPAALRDYQLDGVEWLVSHLALTRAVMLLDEAGLGKTLQALEASRKLNAQRIIIVSPAGARRVWEGEIARWFPHWTRRVLLLEPPHDLPAVKHRLEAEGPLIVIVGYDEFSDRRSHVAAALNRFTWGLLILDEAHYLKNASNRTQSLYGLSGSDNGLQARANKVILLTGTPTPNHAGEIWQHYRTFWPTALGPPLGQHRFEDRFTRYRDTVYGRQITGSKNQPELRTALAPYILRRRKSDVLTELPPLQLQDIPLVAEAGWLQHLSPGVQNRAVMLTQTADEHLLQALTTPDGAVATLRRELGELKVAPALLWLEERLSATPKVLVFAWHHSVIEHLRRGLLPYDPVVVTGDTSPRLRSLAIERFQNSATTRVFIGQILAAGTAITLTAANEVAIVEPSWVPGENYQAICRAHRLGQRDSVLASFLYLRGTLDERIMQTFRRKAAEIAELQGDDDADPSGVRDGRGDGRESVPAAERGAR